MIYVGADTLENPEIGRLVGMHEAFLNSALYSFEKALVKDWMHFFRGEWVNAILHEEFSGLIKSLKDSVRGEKFILSFMDSLSDKVMVGAADESLIPIASQILGDRCAFVPENVSAAVEGPLLEFVKKNKSDLPRLHVPAPSRNPKK